VDTRISSWKTDLK